MWWSGAESVGGGVPLTIAGTGFRSVAPLGLQQMTAGSNLASGDE